MNRITGYLLGALGVGFCGGWVSCCAYRKKKGLDKPKIVSHTEKTTDDGVELNVSFNTGDAVKITGKLASEPDDEETPDMDINGLEAISFSNGYTNKKPEIITEEEYEEDDGLEQHHFTFYAGDNTLTDDDDNPIDNWRELVGTAALSKMEIFGETVQYVRNVGHGAKYEILLNSEPFEEDDGH